jgi:methylmalonyl-CoA/ethylmalonyl-CoA epimerase
MVIDHVGIAVRSIEKAIEKWKSVFGYEQLTSVVVNTRQKVRVVFLAKQDSLTVKLIEPTDESSPVYAFARHGGGLHHLCFRCGDLEGELSRLATLGQRILVAPQPGEAFENEKIAFVYAEPGLNVELIDTGKKAGLLHGGERPDQPAPGDDAASTTGGLEEKKPGAVPGQPRLHKEDGLLDIATSLGPGAFARLVASALFSLNHYYLLGCNLGRQQETRHGTRSAPRMTPMTEEDIVCIRNSLAALPPEERKELLSRLRFYDKGFTNGYLLRQGDEVAYMQWLVFPEENRLLAEQLAGRFYPLTASQVMIENAFTFPRYRGRGYFVEGTRQLLELARENGYRSALCYVRKDRITSLNELIQMGFRIIRMVREYKLLGRVWRTL